ncbi:MAG: coproporphyrinogen dehydrogenase HemZ [Oscillospiraceae bacterium]|jgi:oxygen-independent coproporphyrinogen-3 oxidase|nr:coproporphyrinogen dehydrogenase HemZ [Oscillospiraceae bacterium]
MTILTDGHVCQYEIRGLAGMFFPGLKIELIFGGGARPEGDYIYSGLSRESGENRLLIEVKIGENYETARDILPDSPDFKNDCERAFGFMLYKILSKITGFAPEWGTLTGVRPVRLVRRRLSAGMSAGEIIKDLQGKYLVSPQKAALAIKTAENQRGLLEFAEGKTFSLYIGIPFCPSRCLYCSFVSHSTEKTAGLIPDYVNKLCEEIRRTAEVAAGNGLKLSTIYIGGGTPTSLSAAQLRRLFRVIGENFDISSALEYTVEAGRADTINSEKLAAIKEGGADRISINPQTMLDSVLEAIGRRHTAAQVEESFRLARQTGFDNINMDLIAGLNTDTLEGFKYSLDRLIWLSPENITVHTLSVKRSSDAVYQGRAIYDPHGGLVSQMLEYARGRLDSAGYFPYYLYRQKNTRDNQENAGFAAPGRACLYNIFIMEEIQTILACGAGAVSKLYMPGAKIERIFNYKFPYEYLKGFGEIIRRKQAVYNFYKNAG